MWRSCWRSASSSIWEERAGLLVSPETSRTPREFSGLATREIGRVAIEAETSTYNAVDESPDCRLENKDQSYSANLNTVNWESMGRILPMMRLMLSFISLQSWFIGRTISILYRREFLPSFSYLSSSKPNCLACRKSQSLDFKSFLTLSSIKSGSISNFRHSIAIRYGCPMQWRWHLLLFPIGAAQTPHVCDE